MSKDLDGHYIITSDIDATKTDQWNGGSGFNPIGDSSNPFTGALDGQGYEVQGLFIDRNKDYVGLLGYVEGSVTIEDVGLTKVDITGDSYVGGLVGEYEGEKITNSYVTGNIKGGANPTTSSYVGGLAGNVALKVTIMDSYSESDVTGENQVGGIVGGSNTALPPFSEKINIIESYATGDITGKNQVGGIIGTQYVGKLENSYATGDVTGEDKVGGVVGFNLYGDITNSYATGDVTGNQYVGGLVGSSGDSSEITNSYWDKDSTGQLSSSGGGTKLTTSEMQGSSASTNMAGFDFTNTWDTVSGDYPELSYQP